MNRSMSASQVHRMALDCLAKLEDERLARPAWYFRARNIAEFTQGMAANAKVDVNLDDWMALKEGREYEQ